MSHRSSTGQKAGRKLALCLFGWRHGVIRSLHFVASCLESQRYVCAKDWMEDTMLHEEMVPRPSPDRRFVLILLAVQPMNEMFRYLYRGGVWLDRAKPGC